MRRSGLVLLVLTSIVVGALDVGGAGATGETTTTAETTTTTEVTSTTSPVAPGIEAADPITTPATDAPLNTAVRGPAYQVTPTEPPPPTTTVPVVTTPPFDPSVAPANSGTGRRAVYSKGRQRVWVIEADNSVVRTYLVSGRMNQPNYGTYKVFSRSAYTCSIVHTNVCMRYMVRFTKGPDGDNIGFHEIPRKDGVPIQKDSQLGRALSSGCIRQATADAQFMWNWAGVGTTVVVIP